METTFKLKTMFYDKDTNEEIVSIDISTYKKDESTFEFMLRLQNYMTETRDNAVRAVWCEYLSESNSKNKCIETYTPFKCNEK